MYEVIRKELEKHGLQGMNLETLLENTGLTKDQLYQTLGDGLHRQGIESWTAGDGGIKLRNRPSSKRLFKHRSF